MSERIEAIKRRIWDAMNESGPMVQAHMRDLISVPVGLAPVNPKLAGLKRPRTNGTRLVTQYRVVERSKPGEPPRLETGRLWRSIEWEMDALPGQDAKLVIQSDAPYWSFLDPGGGAIEQRPFVRSTADFGRTLIIQRFRALSAAARPATPTVRLTASNAQLGALFGIDVI